MTMIGQSNNVPHVEVWLPVVGWEDFYEISDFGRLRRIGAPPREHPKNDRGYPAIVLRADGRKKARLIHTLVAEAFIGLAPPGHEVNHINSDRGDARLANLEYVTHLENMRHSIRAGRNTRGTQTHTAKLTEAEVVEIRRAKATYRQLAERYEISQGRIYAIRHGKSWAHVLEGMEDVERIISEAQARRRAPRRGVPTTTKEAVRGSRNGASKLKDHDVRAIRTMLGSMSQRGVAARFGVSASIIAQIATGKQWSWLK